jgi:sortase (surface protein transpeptidase)
MARATKLTLSVGRTRLVFSFRRFRTQKTNRSKSAMQLVLPLHGLAYKEIAVTRTRLKRRQKRELHLSPSLALAILGLVGIGYFSMHLKNSPDLKLVSDKYAVATVRPEAYHMPRSTPTRIRIASIDLDASLAQVGLKTDGSLQVPSDPYQAGWYQGSPAPGEIGPAVIDGHVDKVGGIAVFWRLRELKQGDIIEINRADGTTARFKTSFARQFSQDDFPTKQIYGNTTYAGLRLITCGGIFNPLTGHYSDNIVVFATLTK